MDMLAARSFRVLLAVALAANCFLSCYTLAYADESQGVENVPQEEQEEIFGDAGGFEFAPGSVELVSYAADGGAAVEGHGADDGAPEGAIEDTTSGYGEVDSFVGSDVSTFGNDFGGSGFAADGNEDSSQFGVSSSNGNSSGIEEDSYSNGEKGVLEYLEDIVYLLGEIADYYRQGGSGISPLADINSVYDQLVYIKSEIGSLNSVSLGSSAASNRHKWTMPGTGDVWNTAKGGLTWLLSEATWYLDGIYSSNSQIRRSTSDSTTYLLNFQNWYKSAFGYGYGGTRVLNSESPGAWLEYIRENTNLTQKYLKAIAGDGVEYSAAAYLRNTRQDTSAIKSYLLAAGGDDVPYSVASWLKSAVVELRSIDTYSGYIRTNTNLAQEKLSTVSSLTERAGNFLKATADNGVDYSAASYLHTLAKNSNILLGYSKSKGSDGVEYSFTGFLNMIAERTRNISSSVDKLLGSSSVDLSETNKLLGLLTADVASIRDKYVVGDSLSDMFGALVGDLQVPATSAAIDGIKGAMSTAFPFCIPSVVNLVLFGSVVADPQAPVWEFDIVGSPLVVDFAPYEDFAEVCRWTVRLLFVAALLLNTRKFVYGVGGAY